MCEKILELVYIADEVCLQGYNIIILVSWAGLTCVYSRLGPFEYSDILL